MSGNDDFDNDYFFPSENCFTSNVARDNASFIEISLALRKERKIVKFIKSILHLLRFILSIAIKVK